MGDSQLKEFGECAKLIRNSINPNEIERMPYIGLEHIVKGSLTLNSYGWSDEISSTKARFSKGDILFGKLRPYFRKVIRAPFDGICSTDIWVVEAKEGIDQGYIYYWMADKDFIDFATQGSEGTKMPRAKWDHVSSFKRTVPPLPIQRRIAHILGTLDDKIELNRRMNRTLEAIARAIFKSWFVDFDPVRAKMDGRDTGLPEHIASLFSDSFQDSELGKIPKGWDVYKVNDFGKIVTGKTPPTKDPENYGYYMPFIKIPDMHGKVFTHKTSSHLSKKGVDTQENKILPVGSICVSCIATVGLVTMVSEPSQTNQQINSIVPSDPNSIYYLFMAFRDFGGMIRLRGSGGSVVINLNKGEFSRLPILKPDLNIIHAYQKLVKEIFEKILENDKQNLNLIKIRDTLLPRLMRGDLKL